MAYAAAQRPIITTTINMTLAIRLALRRYLGIEPRARTRVARATASTRGRVTAEGSGPVPSNKVRKHNDTA